MITTDSSQALPFARVAPAPAQAHLARIHAKCIARYRLKAVPGRPEELVQIGTWPPGEEPGMSTAYGCFSIRVRLMLGRRWLAFADFKVGELDLPRLFQILDPHFGWHPRGYPIIPQPNPLSPFADRSNSGT